MVLLRKVKISQNLDNSNTNNFKLLLCKPISQPTFKTAFMTSHATDMLIRHIKKFEKLFWESADFSAINFQLSYKLRVEKRSVIISRLMFWCLPEGASSSEEFVFSFPFHCCPVKFEFSLDKNFTEKKTSGKNFCIDYRYTLQIFLMIQMAPYTVSLESFPFEDHLQCLKQ